MSKLKFGNDNLVSGSAASGLIDTSGSNQETVSSSGAVSITKPLTKLDSSGGILNLTLDAPTALGQKKYITLDVGGSAVALNGANVLGRELASATFPSAGITLLLEAASEAGATLKWVEYLTTSGPTWV